MPASAARDIDGVIVTIPDPFDHRHWIERWDRFDPTMRALAQALADSR